MLKKPGKPRPLAPERDAEERRGDVSRAVSPLLKTSLLFVAFMAAMNGMLWFLEFQGIEPLTRQTTRTVSWLLNAAGCANEVAQGNHIFLGTAHWIITPECSAVTAGVLFLSFVLAYPASRKAKAVAVAAGVPLILIVNVVRLVLLGLITRWNAQYARMSHDYLWHVLFAAFVVTLWLVWIELVVKREGDRPLPR
ncbi:archaeosortase/exosortase family protein [Geomonas oryzisoli]|uniref:Archaeosortase/exosortase family protein n=1 Tax=Geomonas oryzisoli TaxID=2847992 RepID=A0ABX8J605_9BACT|nr:archaeosortase/exosortase family protein [Geomonas oryzisoli]QWV92157.1 archaeosortase/exosortase family protein [Geomonas oryzisoli]